MTAVSQDLDAAVAGVRAQAFCVPTDRRESDGTFEWDSTTFVFVEVEAGGRQGIGWTYGAASTAQIVERELAAVICGRPVMDVGGAQLAMRAALRNSGYPGAGAAAVSAVDVALWDLKAKLLAVSLVSLIGAVHEAVPVYGSGGFCSYTDRELADQLGGWIEQGIRRVKMKVGREPERDPERVRVAREAIGPEPELYVDANGALSVRSASRAAIRFAESDVSWFEEPVSSLDRHGLRLLRSLVPPGMDVAAGEYAYTPEDFRDLVGAVDCLQADVTRCGGITGLLAAAALSAAHELDLSGHTAPSIHAHALCAVPRLRHLEWFHDHVRIERKFFDGFLEPTNGALRPDRSRPGLGLEFRRSDAERYAV